MMKTLFRAPFYYLLKLLNIYSLYCLAKGGSLKERGWFKSFNEGMPIDNDGNPIPWITYAAMSFLHRRITSNMSVFEYGCGNSTLWWAKRVKNVICCEHDRNWYQKVKEIAPSNVELCHIDLVDGGEYSSKISTYDQAFDIIVIDGRDRVNCAKKSIAALKSNGVIIWDNSDRSRYDEGYSYLLANGYKRIDFESMGPINLVDWCTSIFYKEGNCLGL